MDVARLASGEGGGVARRRGEVAIAAREHCGGGIVVAGRFPRWGGDWRGVGRRPASHGVGGHGGGGEGWRLFVMVVGGGECVY